MLLPSLKYKYESCQLDTRWALSCLLTSSKMQLIPIDLRSYEFPAPGEPEI